MKDRKLVCRDSRIRPGSQIAVQPPSSLSPPSLIESLTRDNTTPVKPRRNILPTMLNRTPSCLPELASPGSISG